MNVPAPWPQDKENLCDTRITLGYHTDGAFAEYMLIPAQAVRQGNLFKLPQEVPADVATLLEPLACCLNGQHQMGFADRQNQGRGSAIESLVIFGAGPIGLLHLMLARTRGLEAITVVEPVQHRREMADRLGADIICPPEAFDVSEIYDAAILAVGAPELISLAQKVVKGGGKISLFAGFDAGTSVIVDPNLIHYKQLHITGASESRRRDFAEALDLLTQGKLDPSPLITHRFPLQDYRQAFRTAADGSAIKVLFEM
jgi:L-iditol 2-dehydrogenase